MSTKRQVQRGHAGPQGKPAALNSSPLQDSAERASTSLEVQSLPTDQAMRRAAVRDVQRNYGNARTQRLVARLCEVPSRVLQRYESPEHQDLGDAALGELSDYLNTPEGTAWAQQHHIDPNAVSELPNDSMLRGGRICVGSLTLSPGDVIALMGDFYRTPQALMSAPPEEIQALLGVMRRERSGELSGAKANEEYQKITLKYRRDRSDSYLELAKDNASHFAPRNKDQWRSLHQQAIAKARQAGSDDAVFQEALLFDAAGGHFLTDAFASGHLFDKQRLQVEITAHLRQHPARAQNPEMQSYYAIVESQGAMDQLVLKNIHDRLNTEGVEVTNGKGMSWRTFGDNHLRNAESTRHIAAMAVYLSRRQVTSVRQAGAPEPSPDEVLDLLPDEQSIQAVTAQAITYIPQAVESITALMYSQRRMARSEIPLVGPLVESNLATIANPGRERQLLDLEDQARTTGMPQVAPSFTIAEW